MSHNNKNHFTLKIVTFLFGISFFCFGIRPASASIVNYQSTSTNSTNQTGIGSIGSGIAVTPTPQSIKAAMQQNYIEWPMNSGDSVDLTNNFDSCTQFDSIRFTAKKYFKGKLTVKEVDKNNTVYFPNKNNSYVFGVCEISLEGFSSADIENISITTKYAKDWMQTNKLQSNNIRIFTAPSTGTSLQAVDNTTTTGERDNYAFIQAPLVSIPATFSVSSLGGEKTNPQVLQQLGNKSSQIDTIANLTMLIAGFLILCFLIFYLFGKKLERK